MAHGALAQTVHDELQEMESRGSDRSRAIAPRPSRLAGWGEERRRAGRQAKTEASHTCSMRLGTVPVRLGNAKFALPIAAVSVAAHTMHGPLLSLQCSTRQEGADHVPQKRHGRSRSSARHTGHRYWTGRSRCKCSTTTLWQRGEQQRAGSTLVCPRAAAAQECTDSQTVYCLIH